MCHVHWSSRAYFSFIQVLSFETILMSHWNYEIQVHLIRYLLFFFQVTLECADSASSDKLRIKMAWMHCWIQVNGSKYKIMGQKTGCRDRKTEYRIFFFNSDFELKLWGNNIFAYMWIFPYTLCTLVILIISQKKNLEPAKTVLLDRVLIVQ